MQIKIDQLPFKHQFTLVLNYDTQYTAVSSLNEWCVEHCKGSWCVYYIKGDTVECFSPPLAKHAIDGKRFPASKVSVNRSAIFSFEEDSDAALFKLTWVDNNEGQTDS